MSRARAGMRWIDARFPLRALLRLAAEEPIPGGARFSYALGSSVLFVFLLQAATGVFQLLYYTPAQDHAYDSLVYLRTQVPFGWLVHGLHYWGANAMVVLVGLHMVRTFVWGAYKRPRELVWLAGVGLFVLTAGLMFSGAPLAWDEHGYWAGQVGTNMAGTVPIVGPSLKLLLRGGASMGQLALSRLFVLHVLVLPVALVLLVVVHLVSLRRVGSAGPWTAERRRTSAPFWPEQFFRDVVLASLVFLLLVGLSAYAPPPISGPADPLDTTYVPRPEWNFLFLYEALDLLPGSLEALGTVGIPLLGILVLVALPFVDRRAERDPARRPLAMAVLVVVLAGGGLLTWASSRGHGSASARGDAAGSPASALTVDAVSARAPPAAPEGSATPVPNAGGPGPAARIVGSARHGGVLFSRYCAGCHGAGGRGGIPDPGSASGWVPRLRPVSPQLFSSRPEVFAANLDRFLQHGGTPAGLHPALAMPAFGSTRGLTQAEIADVEAYVMAQNGVHRAALEHPGMRPRSFAALVWAAFAGVGALLVLAGFFAVRQRR